MQSNKHVFPVAGLALPTVLYLCCHLHWKQEPRIDFQNKLIPAIKSMFHLLHFLHHFPHQCFTRTTYATSEGRIMEWFRLLFSFHPFPKVCLFGCLYRLISRFRFKPFIIWYYFIISVIQLSLLTNYDDYAFVKNICTFSSIPFGGKN